MLEVIGKAVLTGLKNKAIKTIISPINEMVDENIADISTTIGSFIIRTIRGKIQRSITFTIGISYADYWMEEALYGVLYEHNKIKQGSKLELTNKRHFTDGSAMYYRLNDGIHNLKYRNWDILLSIQTQRPTASAGRINEVRVYTIITYDLSPEFVTLFEKDMLRHRNSLLKIRSDAPTINVFTDLHESDGYTYWEKTLTINKRKISSIYIPEEQKKILVNTINRFFAEKQFYLEHGIPWNLKILLYGPPGGGKSSIVKMIASEWNRNLYECYGGKNGKFMPDAITSNDDWVTYPLISISDIDKYPMLINEPDVNIEEEKAKEEAMAYKQVFNKMINALDGIMSPEGRIIVMTTNHIEKFSQTILRKGRIDLCMEIGYIQPEVFKKYVYDFYGVVLKEPFYLKSNKLTVADLQSDIVFSQMKAEEFIEKYVSDTPVEYPPDPEPIKEEKKDVVMPKDGKEPATRRRAIARASRARK